MSLTLKELILSLEEELRSTQIEAKSPLFNLEEATIKTRVVVAHKGSAEGGLKFLVASSDVKYNHENTSEHEITVKLKPIDKDFVLGD